MRVRYLSLCLLTLLSITAHANQQIHEGEFVRAEGAYFVNTSNKSIKLDAISFDADMLHTGASVRVHGVSNQEMFEVYKLAVKTSSGYKTVYEWDAVNADLYGE